MRSTRVIIDDIREILQISSPILPMDLTEEDRVIEKALQDLAEVEKRYEELFKNVIVIKTIADILEKYAINTDKGGR